MKQCTTAESGILPLYGKKEVNLDLLDEANFSKKHTEVKNMIKKLINSSEMQINNRLQFLKSSSSKKTYYDKDNSRLELA